MDPDFFMATLQCLREKKKTDFFFIFGTDSECNISHLGK